MASGVMAGGFMVEGRLMSKRRSSPWLRALRAGVAAGILFLLVETAAAPRSCAAWTRSTS